MRVGKREKARAEAGSGTGNLRRREIEADVLEIWIGVSRLMARLTDADPPPVRGKSRPRGAAVSK